MSDMQSMFEGRGTSFVRRLGPRLSSAAVKGLAAAVSLIVLASGIQHLPADLKMTVS
jgi:hypothetical protein